MKRNVIFPVGFAKQNTHQGKGNLSADLTQNHIGLSENTKMSTDKLALTLMLSLK